VHIATKEFALHRDATEVANRLQRRAKTPRPAPQGHPLRKPNINKNHIA
jgi:hypothetical protein